ncbi:MAG: SDR family oxidoreductase [Deltaproteobacteria bacterium]|nr:SDR family oxidoreductase [Deltaproteobacteria bacterium]
MEKTKPNPAKAVLVTGATGFIGRRVALELAQRGHRLLLFCRPDSVSRLDPLIRQLPEGYPKPEIVKADLDLRNLGIKAPARRKLGARVSEIFHLAANYHLGMSEKAAMLTNVDGTRRMLDLAADLPRLERFHFVSTMAVAGDWQGEFREEDLDLGQGFEHAYGRSKFLAETHVRGQMNKLPITVYRPGVVVGDSRTGEMDKIDGPYYLFRLLSRLSRLPGLSRMPMIIPREEDSYFHIVPVDYVVKALVELASQKSSRGQTYHLMDPHPPTYRDFYTATLGVLGFNGHQISRPVSRMVRLLKTKLFWPTTRLACNSAGLPAEMVCHYLYRVTYSTTNTSSGLKDKNIICPRFIEYLPTLIEYYRQNMV